MYKLLDYDSRANLQEILLLSSDMKAAFLFKGHSNKTKNIPQREQ